MSHNAFAFVTFSSPPPKIVDHSGNANVVSARPRSHLASRTTQGCANRAGAYRLLLLTSCTPRTGRLTPVPGATPSTSSPLFTTTVPLTNTYIIPTEYWAGF